ncbi:hypothetical protein EVAR_2403_1 [Eumeta japonica]|uniref:Uncharacterized protein n=1 Tax=Eumeta variegata TaxID=151549 RepID=A0A4C1SQZ6_EUMVA|nr:hypothetical protein EVAR_2403_1 [Eumeta japonica]
MDNAHKTFSSECGVQAKSEDIAWSKVAMILLATGVLTDTQDRREMVWELLRRNTLATYLCGNIEELRQHPKGRVVRKAAPRKGPIKAAIIILGSNVDVEEDQTFNDENTVAFDETRKLQYWRVSVFFEGDMPIGSYLDHVLYIYLQLGIDKINLAGDVKVWSVWWGSKRNDSRGVDLCDFLDAEGLYILN